MDKNQKKFSIYVFLSTFARNLIEVFIPLILYKFGFTLKEVILYYLLVNIYSLIITYPCLYFSSKYNNKLLSIIGIISFILVQILLNNIISSLLYIFILSFYYALYRRCYWISRRFYNLRVIRKDNISSTYSLITIINQIGVIFSSYIGSLFLDFISINALTIIAIILFLLSTIPLYLLKFEHNNEKTKIELFKTLKQIPKSDLFLFGNYEIINLIKFLFTLYLFIYVKETYQTVGFLNLFTNFATILFAYFYGKKINKEKNFLHLSIFLLSLTYFLKLNFSSFILIIISFFEGIFTKMYEISIQKEFFLLSKKFEYQNFNGIYEFMQNLFRTIIMIILYFFFDNLKWMIILVILFILSGVFFNFKSLSIKNYKKLD